MKERLTIKEMANYLGVDVHELRLQSYSWHYRDRVGLFGKVTRRYIVKSLPSDMQRDLKAGYECLQQQLGQGIC